jgi:hypothetical protein
MNIEASLSGVLFLFYGNRMTELLPRSNIFITFINLCLIVLSLLDAELNRVGNRCCLAVFLPFFRKNTAKLFEIQAFSNRIQVLLSKI